MTMGGKMKILDRLFGRKAKTSGSNSSAKGANHERRAEDVKAKTSGPDRSAKGVYHTVTDLGNGMFEIRFSRPRRLRGAIADRAPVIDPLLIKISSLEFTEVLMDSGGYVLGVIGRTDQYHRLLEDLGATEAEVQDFASLVQQLKLQSDADQSDRT
jgi:hypothetical protein